MSLSNGISIENLPVELLYEIQIIALSSSFPFTSRRILGVFQSAPPSVRALYLIGRVLLIRGQSDLFAKALRYPICTQDVFELFSLQIPEECFSRCDLPKRLFRHLVPKPRGINWKETEHPLPFLRYLYDSQRIPRPDANANSGYALAKAVYAKNIPLITFLLSQGASPEYKNCLAVLVAVRQKDLSLVKFLIEREGEGSHKKRKRRTVEDRVEVNREMLKTAVRCDAQDIVNYFLEKGCVPDMQTLRLGMGR